MSHGIVNEQALTLLGISAVTNLGTTGGTPYGTNDARDQDFGYTARVQSLGLGLIGDTVWFDLDNSGGNQTTTYSYDLLSRLTGVQDARGNAWTYTYDTLGRRLTVRDPDLGSLFRRIAGRKAATP